MTRVCLFFLAHRESVRVDWRFSTADARVKLKSLSLSINTNVMGY